MFSTADHEAQVTLSVTVYPLGGSDTATQVVCDLVREAGPKAKLVGLDTIAKRFPMPGGTP